MIGERATQEPAFMSKTVHRKLAMARMMPRVWVGTLAENGHN